MRDLPALIRPGDALVFNDARVIPARLERKRHRDDAVTHIEATLHMHVSPDSWKAFVISAKRVRRGEEIIFRGNGGELVASVAEKGEAGKMLLVFDRRGAAAECGDRACRSYLPPYIAVRWAEDARDRTRLPETCLSARGRSRGSAHCRAAFYADFLEKLKKRGIEAFCHPACRGRDIPAGQS